MGEHVRPVEVRSHTGGEGAVRAPEIASLSAPVGGPDYAGQSLGGALEQAMGRAEPPEEARRPGPIGPLRHAAQQLTAKAVETARSAGETVHEMEQDLDRATEHGLSEIKQRVVEIFSTRYRPSGPEAEEQQAAYARSRERLDRASPMALPRRKEAENAPPPLDSKDFPLQPYLHPGRDRQDEQKRQMERGGRTL